MRQKVKLNKNLLATLPAKFTTLLIKKVFTGRVIFKIYSVEFKKLQHYS